MKLKKNKENHGEETMSILNYLRKNVPEEPMKTEEEMMMEEEDENDHPILKKKKKVSIFGK